MGRVVLRRWLALLFVSGLVSVLTSTRPSTGDPVDAGAAPRASGSAAVGSAAVPAEPPYRIDARKSQFFVQAEGGGVLGAFAHDHKLAVKDFSGTVRGISRGLQLASFDLSIVADSLTLVDNVSESDRKEIEASMKQKVLETARFPTISFRSIGVTVDGTKDASSSVRVVGNLWLHGVGHKITIPMTVAVQGDSLRAIGTTKLHQTHYGIEPYTAAIGTIRVKDEVTLSFDIVATRP